MLAPSIPPCETIRLAALRALNVLDTPAEQRFDRITRFASELFHVPIALVSLVDADRQWFKSKTGLEACQTSREVSFCGHAILSDTVFVVEDARADPRFRDNPLVTAPPSVIFYAGAPLVTDGQRIGTLCLIDHAPRHFDTRQRHLLKELAGWVERELSGVLEEKIAIEQLVARRTQELRESEGRMHAIVDNIVDGIINIGESGTIESINAAGERLFGYPAAELIGRNVKILMPEPYQSEHDEYLRNYVTTGIRKIIGIGREVTGRRKDGSTFSMDLAVSEVALDGQRMFTGIVRDISERKQAEAQLRELNQRFDFAAESAGLGVWDWDIASNALIWDDRMYALYGVRREDFSGAYDAWESAVHPDDRARTVAALQTAVHGDAPYDTEFRITVRGEIRHIKANGLAFRDLAGHTLRMIGINYDISERKKIERLKSEFVSTVSHELRTPLTSIRGSLGLVEGGVAGELPAPAKALVHIAAKNCDRLVRLINEILDMEKIESGKMHFDLRTQVLMPLVDHAVDANQGFATQHGTRYEIVARLDEVRVDVDADRFAQVLTNLLSNAAKYSPPDYPVEVAVTRQDGALRIAVRDRGAGIPPEFQDRLFEKFSQADGSTTREKGGSGLGLSIARAMVEHMGGRIGFESAPGEGSCFWFSLPEAADHSPIPHLTAPLKGDEPVESTTAPAKEAMLLDTASRPCILHVEDDADLGHFVSALLADLADVVVVPSLAAGRRALASSVTGEPRTGHYALLILDPGLPDGSGFDLLPTVKALPYRLPVIVFSASEADENHTGNGDIAAVLVKSRTSNERLLRVVRELTTHPPPGIPLEGEGT